MNQNVTAKAYQPSASTSNEFAPRPNFDLPHSSHPQLCYLDSETRNLNVMNHDFISALPWGETWEPIMYQPDMFAL